ncbi:Heat shock factor-binding protein 1 [Blastocladiella emersonii ATCC 22665]|nr:Heat shock factor-binding protein 1 [Blastocladiella emersonii ATCC 22665]
MSDRAQLPPPATAAGDAGAPAPELAVYVDTLLKQLQAKFDDMSMQILTKIDTMGSRLDDLEKSIAELMEHAAAADGASAGANGEADGGESAAPPS